MRLNMKVGDLVQPIDNDMSLVLPVNGPKNNRFFDQVGIVLEKIEYSGLARGRRGSWINGGWWVIKFPAGLYEARRDALEVISEDR